MPIYKISVKKAVRKFILSRPASEQKRILKAIYKLPNGSNIKKLQGFKNRYRLRIGDVRVLFDKSDNIDNVVKILAVKADNRGDVYK
jgi:mRNA interferase RelE/StbE